MNQQTLKIFQKHFFKGGRVERECNINTFLDRQNHKKGKKFVVRLGTFVSLSHDFFCTRWEDAFAFQIEGFWTTGWVKDSFVGKWFMQKNEWENGQFVDYEIFGWTWKKRPKIVILSFLKLLRQCLLKIYAKLMLFKLTKLLRCPIKRCRSTNFQCGNALQEGETFLVRAV